MVRRRFVVALLATLGLAASVWAFSGPGELVVPATVSFAGPVLNDAKTHYVMVLFYPNGVLTARMSTVDAKAYTNGSGEIDTERVGAVLRTALVQYLRDTVLKPGTTVHLRT